MVHLVANHLGTQIRITGQGALNALEEITRLEALLTRFAPSALTQLNRQGRLEQPPLELVQALGYALEVARRTAGLVTPTVLAALEQAGYSRARGQYLPVAIPTTRGVPAWQGIVVQPNQIELPPQTQIDLGGTAKGWIAERASRLMWGSYVLDAGGDIVLQQHTPCEVAIEHPYGGVGATLELPAGRWGVATSSLLKRAWLGGHHLIHPATGLPVQSPWVQATAVAPQVTEAELLAKLALLDPRQLPPTAHLVVYDAQGRVFRWNPTGFHPLEEAA